MTASIFSGDGVKILKDKLKFKTTGEIHWDATNGCPAYDSDIAGVTNQIGQETHVRVYNPSGVPIPNGAAVYVMGVDPDTNHPSVALAIANDYEKSRVLGLATSAIPSLGHGIVTRTGIVNDLNTSTYTAGDVIYLSPTVAGGLQKAVINDGNYEIRIGSVVNVHATLGSILVFPSVTAYTVETTQKTGWSNAFGAATLSFVDGVAGATRTLTITPVGSEFHWYQDGIKYTKTTDSFQITDVEGLHYVYYDLGILKEIVNPTSAQVDSLIRSYPTVAQVEWDFTNRVSLYLAKELHDMQFPNLVHTYNHFAYGARYLNGLSPNSILADQTGALNSHAQFGVDAGAITDEDIYHPTNAIASTTGLPIYYLAGTSASPVLRKTANAGFSVLTAGTGRLAYNFLTGGNWTIAEATNNFFVLCHVFCINENDINKRVVAYLGQAEYSTVALARAGANTEITALVQAGVLPQERKSIATLILETRTSYVNAVKARIRTTDTGESFEDWRSVNNTGGSTAIPGTVTVFSDAAFQVFDNVDPTKSVQLQVSGVTTGTNRTLTVPDANTTIVGTDTTQTLTNKTFDDSVTQKQIATPATPPATYNRTYPKSDGLRYCLTPSGRELPIDIKGDYNFLWDKVLIADYIHYDDGATAAVPVNMAGAGAGADLSVAASPSPITNESGKFNIRISKAAADARGEGIAVAFSTRGLIDQGALRTVVISTLTSANYVDGDAGIYIYDVSNSQLLYPANQNIFASSFVSRQQFEFQLPTNSTSFKVGVHCQTVNAGAYTIDAVLSIQETKKNSGSVNTYLGALATTGSWVANTTYTGKYWKRGDKLLADVLVTTSGAPTSTSLTINLPSGLTIDLSKMNYLADGIIRSIGTVSSVDNGVERYVGSVEILAATPTLVYANVINCSATYGTLGRVNESTPFTFGAGDGVLFKFEVPIVGWSSNQLLSEDSGSRQILVTAIGNSGVALTADVTNINFTEVTDSTASFDGSIFIAPETGFYPYSGQVSATTNLVFSIREFIGGSVSKYIVGVNRDSSFSAATFQGGAWLIKGQQLSFRSSANLTLLNSAGVHWINIEKSASPQQIAASEAVYGHYTGSNGATMNSSATVVLTPITKVADSHNAFSAGIITAPRSGMCTFCAGSYVACSGSNWVGTQSEVFGMDLMKNASVMASMYQIPLSTSRDTDTGMISASFPVVKNDQIKVNMYQTSGANGFTVGTSTYSWMSWVII